MSENIEDAAWSGESQSERRGKPSKSTTCKGGYKLMEIRGNLPNFAKMGEPVLIFIGGAAAYLFGAYVAFPELQNIMAADTCHGDCILSKLFVGLLSYGGVLVGLAAALFAVLTIICLLGIFNENTIRARVREIY